MKVFINGVEDTSAKNETSLGTFLDQIQKEKAEERLYLSKIWVDDQEVGIDLTDMKEKPLGEIETLKVEFATLTEIADNNLSNAEDYLSRLVPGILKAGELFRSGSEQEASKFFINIIDGIDWFSQIVDTVTQAKGMAPETLEFYGKTILDRKKELFQLTEKMLAANKNKDWVLLADLLEYEIHPYYQEWLTILPQLKSN